MTTFGYINQHKRTFGIFYIFKNFMKLKTVDVNT